MSNSWRYFKPQEVEGLDPELVAMLDRARHLAGIPFVITSGKRSVEGNLQTGGVEDSAHLSGLAVDLRCNDNSSRFKIVKALLDVGFKRIGVETLHIHADIDSSKPQQIIFLGESK